MISFHQRELEAINDSKINRGTNCSNLGGGGCAAIRVFTKERNSPNIT